MSVSHYINGQRKPTHDIQVAIETLFGVAREGWTLAPNGSPLNAPATDLTDGECVADDATLRMMLARRGVALPCDPAEVLAAWARDPWPSSTDKAQSAPAVLKQTQNLDEAKPAGAAPLHVFVRRGVHREVAKHGRALATERLRGRGMPQWEIDEALSMPTPPPRHD